MCISINKLSLILILTSFLLPGIFKHILYWGPLVVLFYRNCIFVKKDIYHIAMMGILFLIIILFLIQVLVNNQGSSWTVRLFGLTKCIMGFEVFFLICKNTSEKYDLYNFFLIFLVFYNALYVYCTITGDINLISKYGSINSCCALNSIFFPVFLAKKEEKKGLSHIYLLTFIAIAAAALSSTFYASIVAEIVCLIVFKFKEKISLHIKQIVYIGSGFFFIIVGLFLYNLFNSSVFAKKVIIVIQSLDMARANIYTIALNTYKNSSLFVKIFGNGNNIIYRAYDSTAAHNFILEMALVYGAVGVLILVIETYVIIRWTYSISSRITQSYIFLPLIGGYVMFLFHPFYTTFYIQKYIFILAVCQIKNLSKIKV